MNYPAERVVAGFLVSLLVLSAGCASRGGHLTDPARAELQRAGAIRVVHVVGEPFRVVTPVAALGGIVAWAVDREMGKSWAKNAGGDALTDPIVDIKERFAAALATKAALPQVSVLAAPVPENGHEALRRSLATGLAFDLQTKDWLLLQPSGFSADYQLVYKARARLVRIEDGHVLWQTECDAKAPTRTKYQAFTADGGRLIRTETALAAEACSNEIIDRLMGAEMAAAR